MPMSGFSALGPKGSGKKCGQAGGMSGVQNLFRNEADRINHQNIIDGRRGRSRIKVKKVKVEIFDMSDPKQVRRYERLWKELLEKASEMKVVIDHSKDLVRRSDGTSYWMKYVEYAEFDNPPENAEGSI